MSLLSAEAVRERAHRMLALGLDDKLAEFPRRSRPPGRRGRSGAGDDAQGLSLARRAVSFALAAFRRRRRRSLGRRRRPRPTGPIAPRARARNSISPSSACCSMPARARRGATAIPRPDQPSAARKGWRWRASRCSRAARSRPIRAPVAGRRRRACESWRCRPRARLPGLGDQSAGRASKAAPTCCAGSARLVAAKPEIFGRHDTPRPGGLFDQLAALADGGTLPAPTILSELLHQLGPIWPSRLTLGGVALGDCWRHPALTTADATSGLVPLHKLSQWLAYSLIEPLQTAGIDVTDIDGLTGLAEYRNGGLFIDTGVLALRDPKRCAAGARGGFAAGGGVARADGRAARSPRRWLRQRLGLDATSLPLAKVLEGGTWAAAAACARTPRRRVAAAQGHQRRHGILDRGQQTWKASRSSIIRWCSTS